MAKQQFTAIDLFAGAGGLSEGFSQAGFSILAGNDFDQDAAKTFELNHPNTAFIPGPIQEITTDRLLEAACVNSGELDVLIGGPPCQAFSVYNHQRGMHDERSGLFREYLRIVEGLMPRFVVMENVTGITSIADGHAVQEIYQSLDKLGYHVEHKILKAEEFGVPQERRRIFFIASRATEKISWPKPSHGPTQPYTTVHEAIGDLPSLTIDGGGEEAEYDQDPFCDYQKLLRKKAKKLFNHSAPFLSDINLKRLKHIPQGGSWRDIPFSLLPAGMKRAKRSDHTKRYGRLHPQGLASTILTKCDLHWGAYIHPHDERCLTVREAARFQSFPDHFRFLGSRMEQFRQVGNAVPPLVGKAVARAVATMLRSADKSTRARKLVH